MLIDVARRCPGVNIVGALGEACLRSAMSDTCYPTSSPRAKMYRSDLRRHLDELIEALDRRAPHIERSGEALIARDAAALRRRAVERLAELDAERRSRTAGEP
jgi:hypothetical protein